ncbi:MAG TPA: PilZ domain-containing protein [Candidatus Competibacteraceae bacterium]|nr:PilZ domain-containing protein [Candidatus Competibacteraceae bacterium]
MSSPGPHPEQRRCKRWHLVFYLRAFEAGSERLLGHVVDINHQGMKLISDVALPTGQNFRLWLDVPLEDGGRERLHLHARSLWSQPDVNPDFYDTGFELLEPSPETVLKIQLLIDDLRL